MYFAGAQAYDAKTAVGIYFSLAYAWSIHFLSHHDGIELKIRDFRQHSRIARALNYYHSTDRAALPYFKHNPLNIAIADFEYLSLAENLALLVDFSEELEFARYQSVQM